MSRYGVAWVPSPTGGWLQTQACLWRERAEDSPGPLLGGLFGLISAMVGATMLLDWVPGDAMAQVWWGAVLTILGLFLALPLLLMAAMMRRVTRVENDEVADYRGPTPREVVRIWHELREPVLRSQAGPVWWAYRSALAAYAVTGERVHLKQVKARAAVLGELFQVQEKAAAARLLASVPALADDSDLEQAKSFLEQLDRLDGPDPAPEPAPPVALTVVARGLGVYGLSYSEAVARGACTKCVLGKCPECTTTHCYCATEAHPVDVFVPPPHRPELPKES